MTAPNGAPSGNEALMGGSSVPALKHGKKHAAPGELRGGRIVAGPESYQVREKNRDGSLGNPKLYPSGDPIYGVHVDVQTSERDPAIENDDGVRRIYIEGSLKGENYNSRRKAVVDAVRAAGAQGLEIGGDLQLAWTREVETGAPSPAQDWVAQYARPANLHLTQPEWGAPQQAPAPVHYPQQQGYAHPPVQQAPVAPAPVAAPQQAAAPPVAPAAQQFSPEQLVAMQAAGIDISQFGQPAT